MLKNSPIFVFDNGNVVEDSLPWEIFSRIVEDYQGEEIILNLQQKDFGIICKN